jgi:hypothetical protein
MKHQYLIALLLLSLPAAPSFSQNNLDRAGLGISSSTAYSLRLLSNSYAGYAIQVRRSSDNATQNIGFTASGDLDTSSLKTFTGANSAYISIWYDQSGNAKNLSQATAALQPSIVLSGVINRENNKPFIRFSGIVGAGTYNAIYLASPITTVGHVSAIHKFASGGDGFILGHQSAYYWHSNPSTNLISNIYASTSVQNGAGWTNGVSTSPLSMVWPTTLTINELAPSPSNSLTAWDNIGTDRNGIHNTTSGGYSELIVFPNALSINDRGYLEGNQSSYYSIGVTILPVTWLSFTVQAQDKMIVLKWQTASEFNSKDFTIQYSSNGNSWSALATQPASVNSNTIRDYSYNHQAPHIGVNYYRILQSDLDGNISYSEIKVIKYTSIQPPFEIIRNRVGNEPVKIKTNTPIVLSLYNVEGKLFWNKSFNPGIHIIEKGNYSSGTYLLKGAGISEKILF